MLAHYLALDPSTPDEEVVKALADAMAGAGLDPQRAVPLLAPLISVGLDGIFEPSDLAPAEVAEETTEVILGWWRGLAAKEARAILIEDLDLADPSTIGLVNRAVAGGLGPGMFLVLTSRPGALMPEVSRDDTIDLGPLPDEDARELIAGLSTVADETTDELIERGAGNPLFLKELARAHGGSGRVVPGGLRDLLMARLDDAGDLELAQIASVVGRTIEPEMLEAAAGHGELASRIENLVEQGILVFHNDHKGRRLHFTQPLLGETAYASLPTRQRQTIHSKLADIYLAGEDDLESSSVAALHLDRAARHEEAARTYLVAADSASTRGAFSEALRHLTRAQQLAADELGEDPGRELQRVAVLRTSFILVAKEGFGSEAASAAASQALELAPPDSATNTAGPLIATFAQATILGQRSLAEETIMELEAQLERASDADRIQIEAEIVSCRGLQDFGLGRFTASRRSFERALESYHGAPRHGAPWPEWPLPTSLPATANAQLIPIYWIQGDRSLSEGASYRAQRAAESVPYPMDGFNLAYAVGYSGWVHYMDGEVAKARSAYRQQGDIGRQLGFAMWEALADAFEAVASASLEPSHELADDVARRREQAALNAGSSFQPYLLTSEGVIRWRAGQVERALELFDESLALAESTSEFIYLPETHRLRAAALSAADEARQDLEKAWEIATSQDAHIFALRAALDLAGMPGADADDIRDRVTRVLGHMGEPETYQEHELARQLLAESG
jgi:tetratricopeptide (TPR) repeat protein